MTQDYKSRIEELLKTYLGDSHSEFTYVASGGMSLIYKAFDPRLEQWHAIKVFYGPDSREGLRRFRNEIRIMARLRHPHIRRVLRAGDDREGSFSYMVMDFVDGEGLDQRLRRGPLDVESGLRICKQLTEAVRVSHDEGVIHRDLKPGNVLLDKQKNTFLTDFGIARVIRDERVTELNVVPGTPPYMAPELFRGHDADARTDIYSLGCVFYEMFTGRLPRGGQEPRTGRSTQPASGGTTVEQSVPEEEVATPATLVANLPPVLDKLIMRMISRDRTMRPESCSEVLQAFEETGSTPPEPPPLELVSLTLEPATAKLSVDETLSFAATAAYTDGSVTEVTSKATWTSSAPDVVVVRSGVAEARKVGSAAVRVSMDEQDAVADVKVKRSIMGLLRLAAPVVAVVAILAFLLPPIREQIKKWTWGTDSELALAVVAPAESEVYLGEDFTYRLDLRNQGDGTVREAVVSGAVADADIRSVETEHGKSEWEQGHFECRYVLLPPHGTDEIAITLTPTAAGALFFGGTVEWGNGKKESQAETSELQVVAEADVTLDVRDASGPHCRGVPVGYQVTVRNQGPSPATGLRFLHEVPERALLASSSLSSPGRWEAGEGTWSYELDDLSASEEHTFRVELRGDEGFDHAMSVRSLHDPDPTNSGWSGKITPIDCQRSVRIRIEITGLPLGDPGMEPMIHVDDSPYKKMPVAAIETTKRVGDTIKVELVRAGYFFSPESRRVVIQPGEDSYTISFAGTRVGF